MEKLKVYIIGDPAYKTPFSKQLDDCAKSENYAYKINSINEEYQEYSGVEFIDIDNQEKYDSFLEDNSVNGLVLLYDELFSNKGISEMLKKQGIEQPSHDQIWSLWGNLTQPYFEKLFDKLIPLIEGKQIYLVLWTDVGVLPPVLMNTFMKQIGINDDNIGEYNLEPRAYSISGEKEPTNVDFMFGSAIFPIITKILSKQIEIKPCMETPSQKKYGVLIPLSIDY